MVRTRLSFTTGQTQGWSFSLEYDDAALTPSGSSVTLTTVTTSGTQTATVQNGGPPDLDETSIRPGFKGLTQGIIIDNNQVHKLSPTSNFVTARACYRLLSGSTLGIFPLYLKFTHEIGDPEIRTIITQNGQSIVPCVKNFTLSINVNTSTTTSGGCSISGAGPMGPGGGPWGGGGPQGPLNVDAGMHFKRGDANASGSTDISDTVFILTYLFQGTAAPTCADAADPNDDERQDVSDAIYLLRFLFQGGAAPPAPFPGCGPDLTDTVTLTLTCNSYAPCTDQLDTDGDLLRDSFEAILTTDPTKKDTDGDLFEDGQEVLPTGVPGWNGGAVNISKTPNYGFGDPNPAEPDEGEGADPKVKDIFIEADYMVDPTHSHKISTGAINMLKAVFLGRGFKVHVDYGQPSMRNGNSLLHQQFIDFGLGSPTFEQIMATNFDSGRGKTFSYSIWGHFITTCSGCGGSFSADRILMGDGALVGNRDFQQASFLMHELGHGFGLYHGGNDNIDNKLNYSSVMNIRFSSVGVDTDCDGLSNAGVLEYSGVQLSSLIESDLNEPAGICGGVSRDWNNDGDKTDLHAEANLNFPPDTDIDDIYPGFNDWASMDTSPPGGRGGGQDPPIDCPGPGS